MLYGYLCGMCCDFVEPGNEFRGSLTATELVHGEMVCSQLVTHVRAR